MNKQKIYWKAPYFIKNWIVSINTRKLERVRYGPPYERILAEIAEHDKWSTEQFIDYQRQQLYFLIQHASEKVPYYRKIFAEAGINPKSVTGVECLQQLPILEKEIIRSQPENLLDETLDIKKLVRSHTSGTTGTPLNLYRDVRLNSAMFAYFDARCREVAGMRRRRNPSVSLGGHLVAAPGRTRPPFWVHNRRWKQLYMSSYHLSPKYLGYYVNELRKFKADYIEGYPSSVYAIAKYIVDNNLEPIAFKACFTTAETLFDYHRRAIEEAFGCRTYNQYGCAEMAIFAAECPAGSMHLSPEIGLVEVVDDEDRPVPDGQVGQLICTSLINWTQPLIRYRLGDLGALKTGRCSCGSRLPMLGSMEGRTDDVLVTSDGRQFSRITPILKGVKGIVESQIIQNDYDKFVIRIMPGKGYTEASGREVAANLTNRVGKADIRVEIVEKIERTSAGKLRTVICNLPKKTTNSEADNDGRDFARIPHTC